MVVILLCRISQPKFEWKKTLNSSLCTLDKAKLHSQSQYKHNLNVYNLGSAL